MGQKVGNPVRVGGAPCADRICGHALGRHLTAPDQFRPDRTVGMPIPPRIAEPHGRAVVKPNADGTLDLRQERLDRAVEPDQFPARQKIAGDDLAPAEPGAIRRKALGTGVERVAEPPVPRPPPRQFGFVVAGEMARLRRGDGEERLFEKETRVALAPVRTGPAASEAGPASGIDRKGGGMIVRIPARQAPQLRRAALGHHSSVATSCQFGSFDPMTRAKVQTSR